jgi:rhamnosyl/mannosyltransferase
MLATPAVPTVITYHSDVVRQRTILKLYGPALKKVLRRASRVLVTSEAYLDSSPWLQPVRDRCLVVPLGIDLAPFLGVRSRGDGRTLLFVGRFRYYKGLQYLIAALALLPEARLLLVGTGPMEQQLRLQVQSLGLDDRVLFISGVPDDRLPDYYAQADVFVLPACERSEAFGLVLAEACASGVACVSTELGTGTSYVNLDGVTGLVVPPAQPADLAAACGRLLADAQLRQQYGRQARERAAAEFDIRRVANVVAGIYRSVLARSGPLA